MEMSEMQKAGCSSEQQFKFIGSLVVELLLKIDHVNQDSAALNFSRHSPEPVHVTMQMSDSAGSDTSQTFTRQLHSPSPKPHRVFQLVWKCLK